MTPWADTKSCAEQIAKDYVVSWRPNPAQMVCVDFEPDRIKSIVKKALKDFRDNNCIFDITLKDVATVCGKKERLVEWVKIVRETIEES